MDNQPSGIVDTAYAYGIDRSQKRLVMPRRNTDDKPGLAFGKQEHGICHVKVNFSTQAGGVAFMVLPDKRFRKGYGKPAFGNVVGR